ncbi:MAG TPA: glycerate kinase [Tepidisphaeraceae bacterium]
MNILIAMDKFRGSLTQQRACDAVADAAAALGMTSERFPLADGGEGSVLAIAAATGARVEHVEVTGPLAGMRVTAPVAFLESGRTAIVELASASGLHLLPPDKHDPTRTTTYGTGELLKWAADRGAKKIILFIGGSATCDAGLGIAQAWGGAVKMTTGKVHSSGDRKLCGGDVGRVTGVSAYEPTYATYTYDQKLLDGTRTTLLATRGIEFVVACDVGNPLYGLDGAAYVFGPQKGASDEQVKQLDADLRKLADRLRLQHFAASPGAGAAGGAGFGMMAFFGAEMVSGVELFLSMTGLLEKIATADLVITGEGRIDSQTLAGKAPLGIARACKAAGVPCIVIGGSLGPGSEAMLDEGATGLFSIVNGPMLLDDALADAAPLLTATATSVLRTYLAGRQRSVGVSPT